MPPVSPISKPALLRQLHVGPDADGHHRQFTGELRAVLQLDARQFAVFAEEFGDAVIGDDVGPFAPDMVFHELGQFPVQEHEQLRQHLDDRDLDAGELQRLAGLDADQAAADHDRLFDLPFVAHFAQEVGVLHGLQRGDAV